MQRRRKAEFRRMHINLVRFLERHLFDLVSLEDILSYLRLLGFTDSIWLVWAFANRITIEFKLTFAISYCTLQKGG